MEEAETNMMNPPPKIGFSKTILARSDLLEKAVDLVRLLSIENRTLKEVAIVELLHCNCFTFLKLKQMAFANPMASYYQFPQQFNQPMQGYGYPMNHPQMAWQPQHMQPFLKRPRMESEYHHVERIRRHGTGNLPPREINVIPREHQAQQSNWQAQKAFIHPPQFTPQYDLKPADDRTINISASQFTPQYDQKPIFTPEDRAVNISTAQFTPQYDHKPAFAPDDRAVNISTAQFTPQYDQKPMFAPEDHTVNMSTAQFTLQYDHKPAFAPEDRTINISTAECS